MAKKDNISKHINMVAKDATMQKAIINGMFDGCEVGTDIWEYIEGAKLSNNAKTLCYGTNLSDPETDEDEIAKENENMAFGAIYYGGHEAAVKLIEAVKKEILKLL